MNTSEVLNRAADLIEERGWTTGCGWPGAEVGVTALCLEGGIMAALEIDYADYNPAFLTCPAYMVVRAYVDKIPFIWNDKADRTASEVIEVLRACAVIEAAKENDSALALLDVPVAGVTSVRVAAGEASS